MLASWLLFLYTCACTPIAEMMVGEGVKTGFPPISSSLAYEPHRTIPRNWNKPFHGQPSPKCWRSPGRPGKPNLQAGEPRDDQILGLSKPLKEKTARNVAAAGLRHTGNKIYARQPQEETTVRQNLLAVYHFSCPQGGHMSQMFYWGVEYVLGDPNVEMIPWRNILGFSGTYLDGDTDEWASNWNTLWCMPADKSECWYIARGHTHGVVDWMAPAISIEIYTATRNHAESPRVTEFCGDMGHVPQFHTGGSTCIISSIQLLDDLGDQNEGEERHRDKMSSS